MAAPCGARQVPCYETYSILNPASDHLDVAGSKLKFTNANFLSASFAANWAFMKFLPVKKITR